MNEVIESILTRRSVRTYKEDQISDRDLEQILEAAKYAPSGMNAQGWHFTAVQNKEMLTKLNAVLKEALSHSQVEFFKKMSSNPNFNFCYSAPTLIIASNNASTSVTPEVDCAAALENIFLAAHSLNIGSCWINILNSTCNDPKVRSLLSELGVPEGNNVYGSAALGFNISSNAPKAPSRKEGTVNIVK